MEMNRPPSGSARFPIDHVMLKSASERLRGRRRLVWLLGGSCTGKTTVCNRLASLRDIATCDMDARIFGSYLDQYSPSKHPASCEWLTREDALRWALSLSWQEFHRLNEATNVEILDLFAQEITKASADRPLLVDGGLSHPYLLAQVLPTENIVCIRRQEKARADTWNTDDGKLQMKTMVLALPDGANLWNTFLHFDTMITKTLHDECLQAGIRVLSIENDQSIAELARLVDETLALGAMP